MSKLSNHPVFIWLPVILVMGIILLMSTMPAEQAGDTIRQVSEPSENLLRQAPVLPRSIPLRWGKIGHVVGYGVLGLVLYRALRLKCRQGTSAVSGHQGMYGLSAPAKCRLPPVPEGIA